MRTLAPAFVLSVLVLGLSGCAETTLKTDVLQQLGLKPTPLASGPGGGGFVASNGVTYSTGLWGGIWTYDSDGAMTTIDMGAGMQITNGTVPDFGADGVVAWGRWSAGSSTPGSPLAGNPVKVLHYAVSGTTPSTATVMNLSRTYTTYRSSPGTIENAGVVTAGSPDSVTGTVTINYPSNNVTYSIAITIGGHKFSISNPGTPGTFQFPFPAGVGNFFSNGAVTSSTDSVAGYVGFIQFGPVVQGMVFGSSAERVVLNYGFSVPSLGNISGAVVFR